jgi:hypothetical protein
MNDTNLPRWKAGTELVSEDLNQLSRAGDTALSFSVDASTGLELVRLPHARILRANRKLECWVKITGGGASGIYAGTEQLEASGGTWSNGIRSWTAGSGLLRESNGLTTVPIGGTVIVRAWNDRYFWRFVY